MAVPHIEPADDNSDGEQFSCWPFSSARTTPVIAANIGPLPTGRERLAANLEALAAQVRAGDVGWDMATVVLHSTEHRSVQVEALVSPFFSKAAREDMVLAALQRALTRWSLPLE